MISISAHHNSIEDFDYDRSSFSRHTADIEKRDFVRVNIDMKQRGVGGDDSWGHCLTNHTLFIQKIAPVVLQLFL